MAAGKGRIVLRDGAVMAVAYEYTKARRPGLLEGCFSGTLDRLSRSAFYDCIDLVCQDGTTIELTITMYSETLATFTGIRRVPSVVDRYRYERVRRIA